MTEEVALDARRAGSAAEHSTVEQSPSPREVALMFTDVVGSVELKSRLGTAAYARLLARHDEVFHTVVANTPGARILQDRGDGFFAEFPTAADAVRAALVFQYELTRGARHAPDAAATINSRVGIHLAPASEPELDPAGKAKIISISADVTARVMSLATGRQILLTRSAFDAARQTVDEHPPVPDETARSGVGGSPPTLSSFPALPALPALLWVAHGEYEIKGRDEPVEIFEVGAEGVAPLCAPKSDEQGRRVVAPDEEATLGWRPAVGAEVPGRRGWRIERKLGEGGFGEVWLARNVTTKDRRVFKFCFDVERLRSFRRELALFRLMRETLGERPDIARLYEVKLDSPPFFLESEYTRGGNLAEWAAAQGGLEKVSLDRRLRIVAQVADAVAAAHSVGVLHKDIKPSNILIETGHDRTENQEDSGSAGSTASAVAVARPRLSDFGIGILTDPQRLRQHSITAAGFTRTDGSGRSSGSSGTPMYAPPETLVGKPFTVQGDIYALGVLLYQMIVADLSKPLAPGWKRDITDDVLMDDLAACVDGDPLRRLGSAAELARRLRTLDQRRARRAEAKRLEQLARRRRRFRKLSAAATAVLFLLMGAAAIVALRERRLYQAEVALRAEAEQQRDAARRATQLAEQRRKEVQAALAKATTEADKAKAVVNFLGDMLESANPAQAKGNALTIRSVLDAALAELDKPDNGFADNPAVEVTLRGVIGSTYAGLGEYDLAEPQLRKTVELAEKKLPEAEPEALRAMDDLAVLLRRRNKLAEAEPFRRKVLDILRRSEGDQGEQTLVAFNNLCVLLHVQGKYDQAEPLYKLTLENQRKKFGDNDDRTITVMNNYALLLSTMGRPKGALPLMQRALELRKKAIGEDHPDTLATMNNLSLIYRDLSDPAHAEPLQREALARRERVLGPTHPGTIDSLNNLAMILLDQEKNAEAEAMCRKALTAMPTDSESDASPERLALMLTLAGAIQAQGRPADAEPLYREAAQRRSRVLGEAHADTLHAMNSLATCLREMDKLDDAEPILRKSHELALKTYGYDQPITTYLAENLAGVLVARGDLASAEPLYRKALEMRQKMLGTDDVDYANLLNNLGGLLLKSGRSEEAKPLLQQSVALAEKLMSPTNPRLARYRAQLDVCLNNLSETAKPASSQASRTN